MSEKIDRTGETGVNNFGSKMVIIRYETCRDVDIYFPQYNWTARYRTYIEFKKGRIKCPYERTVFGAGYFGEGKYKAKENGKNTRVYDVWHDMIKRCYSEKLHEKQPTYKDCTVCKEWHNFQNFARWYEENYYEIKGQRMHLDKDILIKHNKVYSPDTCVFVPQTINNLFLKRQNDRGDNPIGVADYKNGGYTVHCNLINPKIGKSKQKTLGVYDTQEKAFEVYKYYKEKNIKEVADYYKGRISNKLYNALYDYEVEIDD